jgi:hypothetical protein
VSYPDLTRAHNNYINVFFIQLIAAENELRRAESLQDEWVSAILDATRDHIRVHGCFRALARERQMEDINSVQGNSSLRSPLNESEPPSEGRASQVSLESPSSRDAAIGTRLLSAIVQRLHQGQEHSWGECLKFRISTQFLFCY